MSILKLPKGIIQRIEKLKRSFWWMKPRATPGARPHALVNWSSACQPRDLGGLGVFDIEKFGRAMRLRWPWYAWTNPSRPWIGLAVPWDAAYICLFWASKDITIGDGANASSVMTVTPGGPLKLQFPLVFSLARRISRLVHKELEGGNWMHAFFRLSTIAQLT